MISDARGGHVSPGIYTEEKDVVYSVKSLGITSLGLVGETLYGPAFEDIEVEDWGKFVDSFGGTSPELFKGTGLPKYELPYIAKSYLEESKKLHVVRVLGLSGYDAGKVFVLTQDDKPIIVLRSKMVYSYNSDNICEETQDNCIQVVNTVNVGPYQIKNYNAMCGESTGGDSESDITKFSLTVTTKPNIGFKNEYVYNVSLNPNDSDYIYKVLSNRPDTGTTPIYIDSIYEAEFDSSLDSAHSLTIVNAQGISDGNIPATYYYVVDNAEYDETTSAYTVTAHSVSPNLLTSENMYLGVLDEVDSDDNFSITFSSPTKPKTNGFFTRIVNEEITDAYTSFKEMYRPAQTPWVVSDVIANDDNGTATMRKLFKFITISDGDASNFQIKVSITNINPTKGTFNVIVRDYNDNDVQPVILEKFSNCSLVEGDESYIAYKIGTSDGTYASKSKFITVKMAEGEDISNSIPSGFLGFPIPNYGCDNKPQVSYNTKFNVSVKPKRQYFGMTPNNLDSDVLKYKGLYFYTEDDTNPELLSNGFHMDSIMSVMQSGSSEPMYAPIVDGISGYNFTTVSTDKVGGELYIPRLVNKPNYLSQTIYSDINTRKFTVYFYGGFDGWDVNRDRRTNTDEYKASRYNSNGSKVFTNVVDNGLNNLLNLPNTAITSDYYAYLAGYRVFANPQDIDINVFATPGIDWYENTLLVEDVIDIIEDGEDGRGGDALYIIDSPRDVDALDIVGELEDTSIDTSYGTTFYPWVMYFDNSNKRYLELPVTKDVVRNLALTDNTSYPWFAPAGMERGNVNCVKASHKTTLSEEDDLYNGRINPVKTFAQDGVKIWGNKTLLSKDSPLNRINVRRLMIRVKKLIKDAAKHLIFEQYDDTLEKQFKGLVEPILADVRANRGIYDYRVITESTEETRDQHILPAKILIKPTPTLEYISISFVVYPESVSFDEN